MFLLSLYIYPKKQAMKKHILTLMLLFDVMCVSAQDAKQISIWQGERWWGAATGLGWLMPFDGSRKVSIDQRTQNFNNQVVPMLISSQGRGVWSDSPLDMEIGADGIQISTLRDSIGVGNYGHTLRDAYLGIMRKHFSPTGGMPPEAMFATPTYNTWIELVYDQNQADIMEYAKGIVANGFPPGVLMIDDNWQRDYGDWEFRAERFADPKAMVDSLHTMGFKVMLWVCPFVSPDSKKGRDLAAKGYFVKRKGTGEPAVVSWWNGYSHLYDLSNPEAYAHVKGELLELQRRYGIDGFKFDAGDPGYYDARYIDVADGHSFDVAQSRLWARLAGEFWYNELRACWAEGNTRLVQRLGDKDYSWNAVSQLMPGMIAAGLLGYAYTCPDMIGGGGYTSFYGIDPGKFDQKLIVRSCQIHSMMPIMQFSVAPWRILDKRHLAICRRYAQWHKDISPYIMEEVRRSAETGEPIVRAMDYSFPGQGFEGVTDQYMLGNRYLVAPVYTDRDNRTVRLPRGRWRDDRGKVWRGGRTYTIDVPIERLPWFEKI